MKKEYTILENYKYRDFSCIGGDCKYSCCKYWDITIDDDSYKKYRLSNFFTEEMMEKNFTKDIKGRIKFRLNDEGGCPLQNNDGLCKVHSNLGESFLCKTCRIYPRLMNLVDNNIEKGLSTSCPEVVEKLLLDENKIEFNQEIQSLEEKDFNFSNKISTNKENYMKYFWDIRIFTIGLLQNRELSIEERLIALGLFYKKIDEAIKNKKEDSIINIIEIYKEELEKKENSFKKIDFKVSEKIKVKVLNLFIIKNSNNKEYINLTKELFEHMEFNNSEKLLENYSKELEGKYRKFIEEKEYILENYLVNLAFTNLIPYEKDGNVFNKYLELVILYSLVKLYLLGTEENEITEERVVKVFTLLSRVINHNQSYMKEAVAYINALSKNEMNKLAILVTLLK